MKLICIVIHLLYLYSFTTCIVALPEIKLTSSDSDNNLKVNLCIGTPHSQCFDFILNFESFELTLPLMPLSINNNYFYNHTLSSTYKSISETMFSDDLLIENTLSIPEVTFTSTTTSSPVLGLGYTPPNDDIKQLSFLEQLYEKTALTHKVFTIDYSKQFNSYRLILGGVPDIIYKDYVHYGLCPLLKSSSSSSSTASNMKWMCNCLRFILIQRSVIYNKGINVSFGFQHDVNTYPLGFKDLFEYEFKKQIDEKQCFMDVSDDKDSAVLSCVAGTFIPEMIIEFDEWKMVLNGYDFRFGNTMNEVNEGAVKEVARFRSDVNEVLLGRNAIEQFVFVFDKENDVVGFYNDYYVEFIGETLNIKKPSFGNKYEPSQIQSENKSKVYEGKIKLTLFLFGGLVFITLAIFVLLFIRGNKKLKIQTAFESLLNGNNNRSMSGSSSNSSMSSKNKNDNSEIDFELMSNTSNRSYQSKYAIN